jgi:predicted component of type VI protein secretion system
MHFAAPDFLDRGENPDELSWCTQTRSRKSKRKEVSLGGFRARSTRPTTIAAILCRRYFSIPATRQEWRRAAISTTSEAAAALGGRSCVVELVMVVQLRFIVLGELVPVHLDVRSGLDRV